MKYSKNIFLTPVLVITFLFLSTVIGNVFLSQAQTPINPDNLTGLYTPSEVEGEFHGDLVQVPNPRSYFISSAVLGSTDQPKRIEVDLSVQKLYAYEGDQKVFEFLISSGKWGRTPTGTFRIWGKFRYTKMSGGSKALRTYYYLPNVPYVMFFDNNEIAASRGFSLHGTYWHENFGTPMSHGCINMRTEDAEKVFYWSNPTVGGSNTIRSSKEDPGTEVKIFGEAPKV